LAGANNGFTPTGWGESREGFIGSVFSPLVPDFRGECTLVTRRNQDLVFERIAMGHPEDSVKLLTEAEGEYPQVSPSRWRRAGSAELENGSVCNVASLFRATQYRFRQTG
jgi:hypothetical protein